MVLPTLVNHNFLKPPKDYDILFDLSPNTKKVIALEVVESLSLRFAEAVQEQDNGGQLPASAKNKSSNPPITFEPFPISGGIIWKLPSWKHVKWVTQSIAPTFSLGLDYINSITTASRMYCLWLKNPQARPAGVDEDNLDEFISCILLDLSDLFEPRKSNDPKAPTASKRHSELCQYIIKTLVFDLVPNCPLFATKSSMIWNLLVRLLLGITDNLLWNDKQNYLADDLTESLLYSLFFVFLKSGISCDELWKRFGSCFKLWCHRVKAVLAWGTVLLALTCNVASSLSANSGHESVVFGMHSIEYMLDDIDPDFLKFSWIRINNFLPKLSTLSGDIFLRVTQSLQKLVEAWSTSGDGEKLLSQNMSARRLPDADTMFALYGDLIFEAVSMEKTSHENGRSLAISILCNILSKWQYRKEISESYLILSCHYLKASLTGSLISAASTITCVEKVMISGHSGIRCLIAPAFIAVRNVVPRQKSQKQQITLHDISPQELNMACYRLLSLVSSFELDDDPFMSLDIVVELKPTDHQYSALIFQCFSQTPNGLFKACILDIFVRSLFAEDSLINIRFILNSISSMLYSEYTDSPSLLPVLVKIYEEVLIKPPASWSISSSLQIEIQITIVNILEQLSRIGGSIQVEDSQRLCLSLINFALSLHSKQNLPLYLHLIFSIYEAIFSWISLTASSPVCVPAFLAMLVKFLNEPSCANVNSTSRSVKSPTSPIIYGVKTRKSLIDRVFTVEVGSEDDRPGSLSPTLLKGTDEIFFEYTESTLQKFIHILLQEQINSNYPLNLDSVVEEGPGTGVKYFSLSSTIIIGFSDTKVFSRNSVGKFVWDIDFKVKSDSSQVPEKPTPSESVLIYEDSIDTTPILPFKSKSVLLDSTDDIQSFDDDVILNDFSWVETLNNNSKFTSMTEEVQSFLKNDMIPKISLKSRTSIYQPQSPPSIDYAEIISQMFLTNLGYLNANLHSLICPISPDYADLLRLDGLSCREAINIPIHFIASNYFEIEIEGSRVSRAFEYFVKRLGAFRDDGIGPIFSDASFEVEFPVMPETGSHHDSSPVSIVWSEDFEDCSSNIPQSNSNFIYLVILPVLLDSRKGRFFRIRVLLTPALNSPQNILHSFGPLCDGMIVEAASLSKMVRETALFAHRFVSNFLNNSPNPIMKRQHLINSIIFKNYTSNTYGSLLKAIQQCPC